MVKILFPTLLSLALLAAPASAADVKIGEIRAFIFLERSGTWSKNLVGSKEPLFNTLIGEGPAGEPASTVLIDIAVTGDKNSAPKYASAIVNLIQSGKNGQRTTTKKGLVGFLFGESGVIHKPLFLENATCAPLEIEVKVGKAVKTAKIDFQCGE